MKQKQRGDWIFPQCRSKVTVPTIEKIFAESHIHDIELRERPAKASVAIPMYRAGFIAWVAMESLVRQEGMKANWELIIIEEQDDNPYGLDGILKWKDYLRKAQCSRIRYVALVDWIPLSAKWYYLFQLAEGDVIMCSSADLYSDKNRLAEQYKWLRKGRKFNWYKLASNLVYDIGTDKHVLLKSIHKDRPDTCARAMTAELAKKLPLQNVKKSVDGWTYNTLADYGIKFIRTNNLPNTININGLNNISNRVERITNVTPPFVECCGDISNHVPDVVAHHLKESKFLIAEHQALIQSTRTL